MGRKKTVTHHHNHLTNIKAGEVKKKKKKPRFRTQRAQANTAFLHLICTCSQKQRKQLIDIATSDQILSISECAYNILRRKFKLTPAQLSKLRRYKKFVYKIVERNTPIDQRKKELEQSGGFLPALLAPILGAAFGALF